MIKIEHFSKSYDGQKKAVDDLNLEIKAGDIFGFIGHNGAGKTTTIKSITGVMDFEQGDILIDGISIKKNPLACKKILSYIPDSPNLYDHLTGIQYLNFIADIYDVNTAQRQYLIKKYADMLEITKNLGDFISSYSHGMKQKLAIIAALVHSPKILILDEPFVGLDPKATLTLKNIMRQMVTSGGAIFFSTHVLDVAEKLCNKIAVIKDGKLVVSGDIEKVKGDKSLEAIFMELTDNA